MEATTSSNTYVQQPRSECASTTFPGRCVPTPYTVQAPFLEALAFVEHDLVLLLVHHQEGLTVLPC